MTESIEKRFELLFLDGPGQGKSLKIERVPPKTVWLCDDGQKKWWTFKEPAHFLAEYRIAGYAPRREEHYLVIYGVKEPDA